jgi:radical SAM protein with 4Fe4S-binding SPASM domain
MARFTGRAVSARVPVSGSFDLTYRCNLKCTHCYAGHLSSQTQSEAGELSTEAVLRLLSEAADAGCLSMLLSGGEPLLRTDFAEIYRGARRLGLIVTVFTNATLVTDAIVELFKEFPPRLVEVSVYGATDQTCAAVTGVAESHSRAWRGIRSLVDGGVRVGLKTMILRDNLHEVALLDQMARELGVSFRLDPLVTPRLDGDRSPLIQRVDPSTAVALELGTEKRMSDASLFVERQSAIVPTTDLYQCGAGAIGFHLDPQGVLRPCLMSRTVVFDAAALGFSTAWGSLTTLVGGLKRDETSECITCGWRTTCGYCPGLLALEDDPVQHSSSYICRLGEHRSALIDEARKAVRL